MREEKEGECDWNSIKCSIFIMFCNGVNHMVKNEWALYRQSEHWQQDWKNQAQLGNKKELGMGSYAHGLFFLCLIRIHMTPLPAHKVSSPALRQKNQQLHIGLRRVGRQRRYKKFTAKVAPNFEEFFGTFLFVIALFCMSSRKEHDQPRLMAM